MGTMDWVAGNNNHNDVDGSFKEGRPGVGILV